MSSSSKLAQLAELQNLRLRKCEKLVIANQEATRIVQRRKDQLAGHSNAAQRKLSEIMKAATLCPDRMLLAAGHLADAERALELCKSEFEAAHLAEARSRSAWRTAQVQSDQVSEQAKRAIRREDQRMENLKLAQAVSLRAALNGRNLL